MQSVFRQLKLICRRPLRAAIIAMSLALAAPGQLSAATFSLQGQSKGNTNWITSNLQSWQELDYMPCRVLISSGAFSNQTITITFPHLTGTTPGFENLYNFTTSTNVTITSGPILSAPAGADWSYTFTVNYTDNGSGYVQFLARLAAGSHLNVGSSLMIGGSPQSMGQLQIHKPAPGAGAPDLAIVKRGPSVASPGDIITYTLSYTNRATGTNTAHGTQISDILPVTGLIVDTNTLAGGNVVGNSIFWDLNSIAPGASGKINFQVQVDPADPNGMVLTNFSQILSAENDANYSDNSSAITTLVSITCFPPTITSGPVDQTNCPGTPVTFSVAANGSAPVYQWRKDGNIIPGATNPSFTINSVSAVDAGAYDVVVTNACGVATSSPATLTVNTPVGAVGPIDQIVCPNNPAIFSTTASGTGPFAYQWLKDGNVMLGQTNNTLTLNNVSGIDQAIYSAILSGACDSVTNSATLTVNTAVSASPLLSLTNCPGTTAIFSTTASGTGPITYQWLKNGGVIGGETANTLTLNSVSAADQATYSIIVNGACSSVTNSATLTVNTAVSATPLISLTNCPNTTAIFSTTASGTGPFTYQWLKNGGVIGGQTGNSLTLTNVSAANQATYSIIVNGACGSVTNSATLTVNTAVSATPLTSLTNCPNTTAIFSTTASGTGPFTYQWLKNGGVIGGQTGNSLTLTNISAAYQATYSIIVNGACSSVTNSATLTVNTAVSATPLTSLTNCPNTTAIFSTTASGTGPFTYQWLKNGGVIGGQTGNSLILTNVSAANQATYSVIVNGACGSVTNSATLTVNTAVSATPLTSLTNCPNTTAIFSTTASGTGPFSYQWLKNGGVINGETGNSLTLNNVSAASQGTYSVIVSGACSSVTNSATLAVNTAVSATPLTSLTNCPNTTATFSTLASGTGPFSYQWLKNGGVIGGQTGNSLILTNISAADQATYSIIVNGACSSVTNSATLTVNTAVSATPLLSLTNCPGTTAIFSTTASGTGPFTYQWLKNGGVIGGQTGNSLILTNVSAANQATYSIIVNGTCGSVTNSATLTVNTAVSASPLVSLTNCPNTTAIFSTTASGTGPFTYQWLKNGGVIGGQTGNSLILTNVSAADQATYSIIVNGACSSVTNSATLTVNTAVSASPLISLTNCPGTLASFSTTASGTGPFSYQWLKDGNIIGGQSGNSLTLSSVRAADPGTYSVIVSGACGSVTNSATLTINTFVSASPLISLTNCPGTTAFFGTLASGTGPYTYQWLKDGNILDGQTNSNLSLNGITAADQRTYSVIVSGACGSVTNDATLTVNSLIAILPMANLVRNPGESALFTAAISGSGSFTLVWKKNGNVISGQSALSLLLDNVTTNDDAIYTVEATGTCVTATKSATLHVNLAPAVNIFSPTNGQVFVAPANFPVAANAVDLDGIVTNVEFFLGANKFAETTNGSPFVVMQTNLTAGNYTFTAKATDDNGLSAVSQPIGITVLDGPPLTILSAVHFNPQTGLYEQSVRVSNPTQHTFDGLRVYVTGIPASVHVFNASGTTNGLAYVQSTTPVPPGGHTDFVIEYHVTSGGVVPNPTLLAEVISAGGGGSAAVSGAGIHINRQFMRSDKTFMLEFLTEANRLYYIQYTADLRTWKTAQPAVTGNGTWIQWIDSGLPKTESAPAETPMRFYRVIVLP